MHRVTEKYWLLPFLHVQEGCGQAATCALKTASQSPGPVLSREKKVKTSLK
jgi:hypothetical protein